MRDMHALKSIINYDVSVSTSWVTVSRQNVSPLYSIVTLRASEKLIRTLDKSYYCAQRTDDIT